MNVEGRFVLHPEVVLEEDRSKGGSDYIVGRRGTRVQARAIEGSLFRLLTRFRAPGTILDCVIAHAESEGEAAETVLTEAWPALGGLIGSGVLVDADREWEPLRPRLHVGETFAGARVVECVKLMDDFEVYRGVLDGGSQVAIKFTTGEKRGAAELLRREAELLRELGGEVTPRFHALLDDERGVALVSGWCAGVTLARWVRGDRRDRLAVAHGIAESYAVLHAKGVLHVDVNLNNIMVAHNADHAGGAVEVRLIDFAGAVRIAESPRIGRLGVLAFQEPEYLAALANRTPTPDASQAGEQYAVGCALYQVVTGSPPVVLGPDRAMAAGDILAKPVRRFADHGIFDLRAVEAVIRRAMAREPSHRHDSMQELTGAFGAAVVSTPPAPRPPGGTAETLVRALSPGGDWYGEAFPGSPRSSVNSGAGGVALALLELALQRQDDRLLRLADGWLAQTREWGRTPEGYQSMRYPKFADTVADGVSFLHTETGTLWLATLVDEALGRVAERDKAIGRLSKHLGRPFTNYDLALGRTGDLAVAASIFGRTGATGVRALGDSISAEITAFSDGFGPIDRSRGVQFNLGMAHGWAGEIWAMSLWARATGERVPPWVVARAEELLGQARPGRRGALCWPWWSPEKDVFAHSWCNGSAGFVLGFCELGVASGEDRWTRVAERAGADLAAAGWSAAHLCCGAAGGAYALSRLFQVTGDARWLGAAVRTRDRALSLAGRLDTAASLFRGDVILMLLDVEPPEIGRLALPGFW